jgi:membrane associated rhomboid family serine protease
MMPVSLILMLLNIFVSYRGLKDHAFYERYAFRIAPVLVQKDYKRLVTSSFLHVSWMHLIFNMVALYFFSGSIESYLGSFVFILIYFAGAVGGNLLALSIHRHNSAYSSAGASGAITGIIFAAIAVFPGLNVGLFLLPISIPGWLFGLIYVGVSIYGIRSRRDNIGHDAHLGGGIAGLLVALLFHPSAIIDNYVTILIIALPAIAFIAFIVYKPGALLVDNMFFKSNRNLTVEDKYNMTRKQRQQQIDDILEKIHKRGINSLSKKEKMLLEEYSSRV